jgi:hypothetical protein
VSPLVGLMSGRETVGRGNVGRGNVGRANIGQDIVSPPSEQLKKVLFSMMKKFAI